MVRRQKHKIKAKDVKKSRRTPQQTFPPTQLQSLLHLDQSKQEIAPKDDQRTEDDQLCDRCSRIDMDNALKTTDNPKGRFIIALGKPQDIRRYSRCPLCRLFGSVFVPLNSRRAGDGYHLRAFQGMAMVDVTDINDTGLGGPGIALGICRGLVDKKMRSPEQMRCLAGGFISPVLPKSLHSAAFEVQLVSKNNIDFQQMRGWLQKCQTTHTAACALKAISLPAGFNCIDVNSRLIEGIQLGQEYHAFSYVWTTAHPTTDTPDASDYSLGLPLFGIPQLIEDAMHVVRKLGGQYLWVDKYCIDQNDSSQKELQIQAMDKIYEGAVMTIISAPRKDSATGLPGISRPRMLHQPSERIGSHLLASSLSHVSVPVAASEWVTRGWTYQEAVLSERCLFFTDEQVYFQCKSMTVCESIAISSDVWISTATPRQFRNDALSTNMLGSTRKLTGLWEFFENLHHYKTRKLTHSSDSINAFQGLLSRSNFDNIWGVPIACQAIDDPNGQEMALSIGFARGLWWENPGDSWHDILRTTDEYVTYERRQDFPSWSWAGWCGPIRLHKHRGDMSSDTGCNEVDEKVFDIRFWPELISGERISLSAFRQKVKKEGQSPLLSHNLHIETIVYRIRIRHHSTSSNAIPCFCDCPLEDDQCSKRHATFTHTARFFEDPMTNETLSEAIASKFVDIVPLFRVKDLRFSGSIASLIIIWHQEISDFAQVVGVAYLHERLFIDERRLAFRLA